MKVVHVVAMNVANDGNGQLTRVLVPKGDAIRGGVGRERWWQ